MDGAEGFALLYDQAVHGVGFIDLDGKRVDPARVESSRHAETVPTLDATVDLKGCVPTFGGYFKERKAV